jgi:protein MBA1
MAVKRPPEKSLKTRAKELSLDTMPTDLGLLPGTFVKPEEKNLPSFFKEPKDRLRMEWVWLKNWCQNVAGYFSLFPVSSCGIDWIERLRTTSGFSKACL